MVFRVAWCQVAVAEVLSAHMQQKPDPDTRFTWDGAPLCQDLMAGVRLQVGTWVCKAIATLAEPAIAWELLCNAKFCLCWCLPGSPFVVVPPQH